MKGGSRKKAERAGDAPDDGQAVSMPEQPSPEEPGADPSRRVGVDLDDLQDLLREGLRDLREHRQEHRKAIEDVRRLQGELMDLLRARPNLEEFDATPGARALEQVEALRQQLQGGPQWDRLATDLEESRKSWRQSSQAAAAVVGRLEARVEEMAARLGATPEPVAASADPGALQELRERLEGLQESLQGRVEGLEARLLEGLSLDVSERVQTLESGLRERLVSLEESQESFGERLASYVETVEEQIREVLADLRGRLGGLESRAQEGAPSERLDRLEKESHRLAERLDEELDAVFEQNRQRVAEMTDSFNEGMARLEEAMARVERLEEETTRSSAAAQAAVQQLEALSGQVGRLEDQVTTEPPSRLADVVTDLRTRMDYLESRPRMAPSAGLDPEQPMRPPPREPGIDPEEGLTALVDAPTVQPAAPIPAGRGGEELRRSLTEAMERTTRDLEVRVVEQSLEALTEAQLLRQECGRMAADLAELSERVGQHLAALWSRLEALEK